MPLEHATPIQSALERLAAGDGPARGDLLRACRDRVEKIARKMLRGFPRVRRWVETDDLVQEALLGLERSLGELRIDDSRHFLALAAQKVRWCLIDLARRLFGPHGLAANHATPGPTWPGGLPELVAPENTGTFTRWEELHEQAAALPEEEREVFDLLWYHGLTAQEAGVRLGVCDRTVKRRWHDARRRLADALRLEAV